MFFDSRIQGTDFVSMLYDTDLRQIYTFLIKKYGLYAEYPRCVYFIKLCKVFSSLYDHSHPKDSYRTCLFQYLSIQVSFKDVRAKTFQSIDFSILFLLQSDNKLLVSECQKKW